MKKRSKQFRFDEPIFKQKLEFGGSLLTKRKNRHSRPFAAKTPMHLVLKSSRAKGFYSFSHYTNLKEVNGIVQQHCAKYGVKLLKYANSGDHLHLLVKFASREIYLRFIRTFTARLVRAVTRASKSTSIESLFDSKRFFDYRPFTRIVRGLKTLKIAEAYVELNVLEAEGKIPHRRGRLKDVRPHEWSLFSFAHVEG